MFTKSCMLKYTMFANLPLWGKNKEPDGSGSAKSDFELFCPLNGGF